MRFVDWEIGLVSSDLTRPVHLSAYRFLSCLDLCYSALPFYRSPLPSFFSLFIVFFLSYMSVLLKTISTKDIRPTGFIAEEICCVVLFILFLLDVYYKQFAFVMLIHSFHSLNLP